MTIKHKGGNISNTIRSTYGTIVNIADATTIPLKYMRQYTFLSADAYSNNFNSIPQMYLRNLIYVLPITFIISILLIKLMPNKYQSIKQDPITKKEISRTEEEFTFRKKLIISIICSCIFGIIFIGIIQLFRRNITFKLFTGNSILQYYYLPFLIIFLLIFIILTIGQLSQQTHQHDSSRNTAKYIYINFIISIICGIIGSIISSFIIKHILIEKNKELLYQLLEVFKECPSLDYECNSIHKKFIEIFRNYIPESFHNWLESFGWKNAINLLIQRENLEHAIAIKQMFSKNA
jgi:hypothetical protein